MDTAIRIFAIIGLMVTIPFVIQFFIGFWQRWRQPTPPEPLRIVRFDDEEAA